MKRFTSTSSKAPSYRTNDPYGDGNDDASRQELFGGRGSSGRDSQRVAPPGQYAPSNQGSSRQMDSYGGGRSQQHYNPSMGSRNGPTASGMQGSYNRDTYDRDRYGQSNEKSGRYANPEEEEADSYGRSSHNQGYDGDGQYSQQTQEEDEVEGIKQQMRYVKQESLASTRNAVRTARQAEDTAGNTLGKIGDQSERIAMTERALDISKNATEKAKDEADMLKKLNRSIFIPVLGNPFSRKKKAAEQERKILDRYKQEKLDREEVRLQVADSQKRVGEALYGKFGETKSSGKGRQSGPMTAGERLTERGRYQFESTESDDELEDELDNNLDELHQITGRLKGLAMATNAEVTTQNSRLDRISNKTDDLDIRILQNSRRLENIR